MKTNPTYDRIRNLATQLRRETRVTKRREIGEELVRLLSKDDVRRKLATEATPEAVGPDEPSMAASRCHTLSQLWVLVIHGAISVAESISQGKGRVKRTLQDLTLPWKLLVCCDKRDEAFESEGLGIPKLSRKTIRSVLQYCLNMLADDEAVELAEIELLDMLNHMCSRADYVGFFKFHSDFSNILSELSHRLSPEDEAKNEDAYFRAAKVFDSLFKTCRELGIQMNLFIADSMAIIHKWCKGHIRGGTMKPTSPIIYHFYNTMASILYANPEESIGSMKQYGRAILRVCKRCYSAATPVNKDALNNYLLAHL